MAPKARKDPFAKPIGKKAKRDEIIIKQEQPDAPAPTHMTDSKVGNSLNNPIEVADSSKDSYQDETEPEEENETPVKSPQTIPERKQIMEHLLPVNNDAVLSIISAARAIIQNMSFEPSIKQQLVLSLIGTTTHEDFYNCFNDYISEDRNAFRNEPKWSEVLSSLDELERKLMPPALTAEEKESIKSVQEILRTSLPLGMKINLTRTIASAIKHEETVKILQRGQLFEENSSLDAEKLAHELSIVLGDPAASRKLDFGKTVPGQTFALEVHEPQPKTHNSLMAQMLPHFKNQQLQENLKPTREDPSPVPKNDIHVGMQLKPKIPESTLGGFSFVVKLYGLSHCIWGLKFVERINGIDKTVYTGARNQPETICAALMSMNPPWYKTMCRLSVRNDETTKEEWCYYRAWQELTKENMEKLLDTLKKNIAAGAAKIKLKTTPSSSNGSSEWSDRRNRDAWTKRWAFEIVNVQDKDTGDYKPLPWDTLLTNQDIYSLLFGHRKLYPDVSDEQLEAAGGYFSPTSPYNFKMIAESSWSSGETENPIKFSDNV